MKDFILLAPKTATQYQDMFWRIVEGQIFIGINYPTLFEGEEGDVPALSNWLNTVGVHKHKQLNLTKTYSKDKYPAYDNYPQVINVDWIKDIPYDYDGVMGVPITWLDGYYDGYEIVGLNNDSRTDNFKYLIKGTPVPDKNGVPRFGFFCKGKQVYTRILIRRKQK